MAGLPLGEARGGKGRRRFDIAIGEAKGGIVLPKYARGAVAIAIGSLPLLTPSGPGNTGPVDLAVVLAISCVVFAAFSEHIAMRMPLFFPTLLSVLAGGLGAVVHNRAGHATLSLAQDVLMLFWGAAVATAAQHGPTLRWLMRWWVRVGIIASFGLVIGVEFGIKPLSGYTAREFNRAAFTFGDPNRCGLFIMMAFLILRASQYPRRPINRYACATIMLIAIAYTGSNAAVAGLAVAVTVSAFIGAGRRGNVVTLVAWICGFAVLIGTLALTVDTKQLADEASGIPLLANNIGRGTKSADSRGEILQSNINLFFQHNDPIGLGPDGTKDALANLGGSYIKEAHNDYLAAANERGFLGILALFMMLGILGFMAGKLMSLKPPEHLLRYVPRPDLLGAGLIGVAVTAALHQTLHFRHEWAYFGLVAGAALLAVRGDRESRHAVGTVNSSDPERDQDSPFGGSILRQNH